MTPDLERESVAVGEDRVTIDLARAPSLAEPGTAANFSDKEKGVEIVVVRAGKDKYFALSRFCTHAGRTLSYVPTRRVLMCTNANHSIFGLDGQLVKGPAEKPLKSYPVILKDGKLDVALKAV